MTQPERICRECGIAWTGQGNRCPRCEMVATQEFSPQPSDFTQESESSQASDFTQPADVTLDTPVVADTSNAAKRPVNSLVRAGADRSTHFGDYELVKEIARGGMGVVYKAKHRKLQRLTAVKMMLGGRFSSADAMNRFRLEAEAAASLDHPGIVPIYEIGESEGQPFFAMKYIEGGSLASSRDAFVGDPKRIAALIRDIARAVHHAHQRGVLHRDIKPANILIDESGRPLLTDLGLAKRTNEQDGMTRTDAVMGTPAYMSPEQAGAGDSVTLATDIYSLGVILFELLVGHPPHQGSSALEVLDKVRGQPAPNVRSIAKDVDRDLARICMHCLQASPEDRYSTAGALAGDLDAWLRGDSISLRSPTVFDAGRAWMKRNRNVGIAIIALFSAFLLITPVMLPLLGAMDRPAQLYENTERDPIPLIFSASGVPTWISITAGVSILFLWPLLGAMVVILSRPKTLKQAFGHGTLIAVVCTLFLMLTLGWVPFAVTSQASANAIVRELATATFESDPQVTAEVQQELMRAFPKLSDVPENQRVNFVSNRLFADGVAIGPRVMVQLLLMVAVTMTPTIMGSAYMHTFLERGLRWWMLWPRYFLAWLATFIALSMWVASMTQGRFAGKPFGELAWYQQFLIVGLAPLVTFLLVRRWRKPSQHAKRW